MGFSFSRGKTKFLMHAHTKITSSLEIMSGRVS